MSVLFFFITNFTFWLVISPTLASTYPTTVIFVLFSCFMYVNFVIVQYRSKCHFAHSLLKKSPYSELFLLAFFPHFLAFGLNTERYSVSLRIHSECGKIRTRNYSVFGHASRSEGQKPSMLPKKSLALSAWKIFKVSFSF